MTTRRNGFSEPACFAQNVEAKSGASSFHDLNAVHTTRHSCASRAEYIVCFRQACAGQQLVIQRRAFGRRVRCAIQGIETFRARSSSVYRASFRIGSRERSVRTRKRKQSRSCTARRKCSNARSMYPSSAAMRPRRVPGTYCSDDLRSPSEGDSLHQSFFRPDNMRRLIPH
jgi:hypothetical protein